MDYLIVLNHGGIEYYKFPSPLLQRKCREMVKCGADFVVCQHSHCIGTAENFLNGTILYGQGNSVFGYKDNSDSWNNGLLVKLTLSDLEQKRIEYIPISAKKAADLKFSVQAPKDLQGSYSMYFGGNYGRGQIYPTGAKSNNNAGLEMNRREEKRK